MNERISSGLKTTQLTSLLDAAASFMSIRLYSYGFQHLNWKLSGKTRLTLTFVTLT